MTKPLIGIGSDIAQKEGQRDRAFIYTTYVESLRRAGAVPLLIPPQPENAVVGHESAVITSVPDLDPADTRGQLLRYCVAVAGRVRHYRPV